MPRMRTWSCVLLALFSGCIVPRSMVVGQMAAPVGRGAAEVGVFTGVSYASQTNPAFQGQDSTGNAITTAERTAGFTIPNFEANLQYGFNENVGLNVHASSAGIQPGVKLTVNRSKVAHFAIMPQVAVGYGSVAGVGLVAGSDGVQQETTPTTKTSFTFLGGLKLLVSHKSGFYAGVGYDFLFNRQYNKVGQSATTSSTESATSTVGHQISAAVGMDIALGMVHLRPEVAFAVYPGIGQTVSSRVGETTNSISAGGGFGFAVLPGFTLSVSSPRREMTAAEEEEEEERQQEEKRKKRRGGEEEDEDEGDDDEEKPSTRKRKAADDDEEDKPKRRSPPREDDED